MDNTVANASLWEAHVRKRETYTWTLPWALAPRGGTQSRKPEGTGSGGKGGIIQLVVPRVSSFLRLLSHCRCLLCARSLLCMRPTKALAPSQIMAQILPLSCVTLGKESSLSEPPFPHLQNENTSPLMTLSGPREIRLFNVHTTRMRGAVCTSCGQCGGPLSAEDLKR